MNPLPALTFLLLALLSQLSGVAQLAPGLPCPPYCGFKTVTFQTSGNRLLDPCGQAVVLKGVNKMAVFDYTDPVGAGYFPQIALSGANCVRIAWEMTSELNGRRVVNPLSRLDQLITNAKANKLIPIVGLWDYTTTDDGGFSRLNEYVAYWIRPDVVSLIQKHQTALIINIGNEAATGNEDNAADQTTYRDGYTLAIQQIRGAGIQVPLMIDGMDRGKSLKCLVAKGPELLRADTLHNLIFSFHPYWPKSETDAMEGGRFIKNRFAEVRAMTTPIVIVMGEVSKFGAYPSGAADPCSADGVVDYRQLVQQALAQNMGWLVWEWGPGNGFYRTDGTLVHACPNMDMTTNGTYRSILRIPNTNPTSRAADDRAWVKELAVSMATYSLKTSARRTFFINSGFKTCPDSN